MKGKRKVKERVLAWYLVLLMVVSIIPFNMFKLHARADVQSNSYTITVKNQDGELLDDVSIEYVVKLGTETKASRIVVTTTGVAGIPEITDDLLNEAQTASEEVTVDITAKKKGYKEYSNAGISVTASIKNVDVQMTAKQADDAFAFEKTTAAIKYGDSFSNTASSKKRTGTVNYSVVSGDDCVSVGSDGVITTLKSGTAKIKAVLLEDDTWQESEAFYDLTINRADNSGLSFASVTPDAIVYSENATFQNKASGGLGDGEISYKILGDIDWATVDSDGTLRFTKAGKLTVKATKAADDKYDEISVEYTIEIKKASQNKLSFENEAPSDVTITEGTFSNAVSGGTGDGQITYEIVSGLDYASVDDVTLPVITLKKAGTITVKATKAADDRYEEESATYNLTIKKAQQAALTFAAINPEITYAPDWTYTVSVAGGSGTGALSYYILDNGNNVTENDIASIDTVTGVVSKKGYKTGVVKIVAVKAADDSYEATSVTNDLTIKKAEQTGVQFDKNSDSVTYGDNNNEYANQATGGESTGKIVYSIESVDNTLSGVPCASLDQDTGKVTVKGAGQIKIKAVKQGDDCYEDSEAVYYTLIIAKAEQQNFKFADAVPASVTYNENNNEYVLAATGGNGNGSVTYKVVSGDAVEISGNKLTVKKSGKAVIRVDKAESDGYLAAFDEITITVAKAEQSIKFNDTATSQVVYGNIFSNEAVPVVNNSVPDGKGYVADTVITYEVVAGNNIANVDTNGKLTFKNGSIGTVTVKASKLGNSCYEDTECEYTIEVIYLATPQTPYTLSGEKKNDDGWYTGNVTITPATGYKISYSNDLINNDWKDSIEVSDEGLNAKAIYLKNDSGITGAIKINENDIKIDKTKPENLSIRYSKSVFDILLQGITFGFYKAPVTVTLEAKDVTSGIKNFTYSYEVEKDASDINTGASDVVVAVGDEGVTINGSSAKAVFKIDAQFRGKVSFTATDNAGNVSDICKDNKTIVVDDIAPGVSVTFDNTDVRNDRYYKEDRTAEIVIDEENFFVDSFNKLSDISVNPAEVIAEHLKITVTRENDNGITTTTNYTDATLKESFTKGNDGKWRAKVAFTEDGDYTFTVGYSDFSGNAADTYRQEFTIDKTAPQVLLNFHSDTPVEGSYYDKERTADVIITEHNFNPSDIKVSCVAKDADGKDVDVKSYQEILEKKEKWEKSGNTYTLKDVAFDADAVYAINIEYTDLSGNEQESECKADFTVDTTKPENLSISYSKSVFDTILEKIFKFYKAPVTVTLEAKDVTSGIKNFTYSYEVEKDASKVNTGASDVVAAVGDKGVIISGSSAKAVFKIDAQFRGKVSFTATDNAGNVSDICKDNKTIVVDDIAPIVEITLDGPKKSDKYKQYYSDYPVTANIKINEANFFAEAFEKVEDISVNPSELVDEHLKITVTTELNNGTKTEKVYKNDDLTTKFTKGDADEWNSTIKFDTGEDKDAIYTIKVECTDFSGNKAETAEKTFIVDKKDPCINVDFSNNDVRNGKYFNADRKAKITITERNFNAADVELNVTADKAVGNIADYAAYLKNSDNWTNTGDTHTAEITFSTEAFYKFDISYTDMSGRKNESVNYGDSKAATDFVIDKTAPVNSDIKINDSSVLARGGVAFEKFYRNDVTVKFSTNADISGIKSVKYQKVNDLSSYNKNGTWNEYDSQNGVVVKPNEKFVIYFMVEDMAGNTVIVNSTGIVVDDKAPIGEKAAPEIDIIPDAANANGLHNGNVNVAMKVVDPKYSGVNSDINGYYSGINKITYRIYTRDTDAVETGTLMDISANNTNGAVFDKDNLISSWSGNITVDASRFNSNNVVVEVKAVDNAGNERVTTNEMIGQAIKIDITAPAIDVSYDNNTADNNTYFKENRTARIQITERNFNENDVDVRISNTDGVIPSVSGWTQYAGSGNMDNTTWVTYVTYDADGDYKFDISYKDMADNTAGAENYADGTVAAKEFTVDKTNPVIEVSYDNNDAENSNYYKTDRTATISVTEHNFQADRVIVNVTATDDGNAVTAPQISGWTSDGDINTATIYYGSDAYYTFNISMQDMAGNSSDEFTEQNFYVDKTVPELSISGVENNTANSGTVIPVISYSDTNYDESLVSITLTGANRKTVELDGSYAEQHNGRVFTFKDFANEKSIDDIYTLTASITDRAGNVSTQTVVFSVNRFGSTYELSSSTENLNGTYVKSTEDVVLSEVNVNQLTNIKLTLYKNDATIVLKENEDYRVSISGGNGQWYQYTYTVFAKNFSENGVYRITIQSDDATGRTQKTDQDTKNVEIQFGIDNEPPVINVKNLESKTTYAMESKEVEMTVRDNLKLGQVIVELDGNEYKTWSGDELEQIVQNGGNFTFNIDGNSTSAHNIVVYASDAAGNGAKTANADKPANVVNIDDFYVTTNKWVQYINNKPLFYGSIIAVIAVVGLGVFAVTFVRRKKDKAEK